MIRARNPVEHMGSVLRARVRLFISTYAALLQVVTRGTWRTWLGVLVLDAVGALGGALLIGAVAYFVAIAESGQPRLLPVLGLRIGADTGSLLASSLIIAAVAVFTAWASYLSAVRARQLARACHVDLAGRVLERYASSHATDDTRDQRAARLLRGTVQASLSAESLVRCLQPALYAMVALAMLFYFDAHLTLSLLPIAVLALSWVYRLATQVQRDARAFYAEQVRRMGGTISALLNELEATSASTGVTRPATALYRAHPLITTYLDGFDRNRLAGQRMGFLVACMRGLGLACGLGLFGLLALNGERSWAHAIAYLGALLFLFNSAQKQFILLSQLSRFYPQVRDLVIFLRQDPPLSRAAPALPLRLRARTAAGENCVLELDAGSCHFYWVGTSVARSRLTKILAPLATAAQKATVALDDPAFAAAGGVPPGGTVLDNLTAFSAAPDRRVRVQQVLAAFDDTEITAPLTGALDEILDKTLWTRWSAATQALMRIVALSIAPRSLTLLDAVLLRRLPPTVRSRVPALFASGVLLIVAADGDLPSGLCDGAPALAVADDCSLHVGEPAWVTTLALTVGSGTAEAATTDEIEMALP